MKNVQTLTRFAGYGLMASLVLIPTVSLAKGKTGDDNDNGHEKAQVFAAVHIGNDNDNDSDSDSQGQGNGNAFGHLIAPGWIKHHTNASTTVPFNDLPFGISRLFESDHAHFGTTTQATSTTSAPSVFFVFSKPGATSATVSWVTNEPSSSQVSYGTTSSYGATTSLDSSLRYFHSVTITGLANSTTYHFEVMSTNGSGVTGNSSDETFTTTGSSAEPVISNILVSGVSSTTATVSWTTDEPSTSALNYGTTNSYGLTTGVNATDSYSHSETVTGLSNSTVYHFEVVSEDGSGNTSTSSDQTFTTLNTVEPILSNLLVSGIGSTTATVSWLTDEPANSEVFLGTSSPLTLAASTFVTDSSLVINHILQLGNLAANTLYTIVIQSTDSSGNTATSSAQSFTTLP